MFDAVIGERNVGRAWNRFAVKFNSGDAAGDSSGVFDPDFVRSRMISEIDGIVSPRTGNARVNGKGCAPHTES